MVNMSSGCLATFIPVSRRGAAVPISCDFSYEEFEKRASAVLGAEHYGWTVSFGDTIMVFKQGHSWRLLMSLLERRLQNETAGAPVGDIFFYQQTTPLPVGYNIRTLLERLGLRDQVSVPP